ncbi:MAG: DUF4384 domain-containing protein [Planctomycetes bacterium]|nr:DUF4384 domain-containing protein [Planctomycetota bacterium]
MTAARFLLSVLVVLLPVAIIGAAESQSWPEKASSNFDERLAEIASGLLSPLDAETVARCGYLVVGQFTYRDTSYCGTLGELLSAELPSQLGQIDGVKVVTSSLEALEDEKALWESNIVNPGTVPKLKSGYSAVTALVRGRYFYNTDARAVRVSAELVEVATAEVVANVSVTMDAKTLPVTIDEKELAAADALAGKLQVVENAVTETGGEASNAAEIRVWTADGRTVYSQGEKIVFSFRSDRDCYLRLFNIRLDGSALMIFPNEFQRESLIKGGVTYRIPDADAPFQFLVTPPYGPEAVLALATTSRQSSGVLTRGLPGPVESSGSPFCLVPRGVEEIAETIMDSGVMNRGIEYVPAGAFSQTSCRLVTLRRRKGQ